MSRGVQSNARNLSLTEELEKLEAIHHVDLARCEQLNERRNGQA